MKRKTKFAVLLMLIFLIAPLLFFPACRSVPTPAPDQKVKLPDPPVEPALLPVDWKDRKDGGLWLSYDQYRNLEINITRMRSYEERLRLYIDLLR